MARIDYFFSPASAWTYLAGLRLEEIAGRHGAEIAYRPVDLMALYDRTGGTRPQARHPARTAYRNQELARWSARLGVPVNLAPAFWPVNAAPACYAIIAAAAEARKGHDAPAPSAADTPAEGGAPDAGFPLGNAGVLAYRLARACWAEDRDIASEEVIRDCLAATGFDPELVNRGLLTGAETFAKNLDEAEARGVFGAPFYIVAETDSRFWGQDRLEMLDAHLASL